VGIALNSKQTPTIEDVEVVITHRTVGKGFDIWKELKKRRNLAAVTQGVKIPLYTLDV
jgi:hypothetical protein